MSPLDDADDKNLPIYFLLISVGVAITSVMISNHENNNKESAQYYKEQEARNAQIDKEEEGQNALSREYSDLQTAWYDLEQINESPGRIKKSILQDDAIKRIKDAVEQHRTIVVKRDKKDDLSLVYSSESLNDAADCLEDSARGSGAPNPDVERAIQSLRTAASGDEAYLNKPAVRQIIKQHGF